MKKIRNSTFYSLALAILCLPAQGAERQARQPQSNVHVLQMDEHMAVEDLRQLPGVTVHPLNSPRDGLPSVVQQAQWLRETGLDEVTGSWDGFEKDRLFLRLENGDPAQVASRYNPALPVKAVRSLQEKIRRWELNR